MTRKAEEILKKLCNPKRRQTLLEGINRLDQDEPARVGGGDQEMKVSKEMNELQDLENDNWSWGDV